ncbi:MAG TPA: DUF4234 domain-containing protein [Gaiellaceae bacterium]|jgi:hypothetical protein|nr:DUF4234 domain-containing protein [Gaiellaceae bacterium]
MAETVDVRGLEVKVRGPWIAFLLAIVTLGIYYLYWYYVLNRDLNDYGERLEREENPLRVSPGVALLAVTVGWLIIVPPFVSMWRTMARIGRAQQLVGVQDRINHVLGFVLFLIALIFFPVEIPYAQSHVNKVWRLEAEEGTKRALGMRGVAPAP